VIAEQGKQTKTHTQTLVWPKKRLGQQ